MLLGVTKHLLSANACAEAIIHFVGKDLRVGAQLACGKPNHILNALYRKAKNDPSLQLSIMTALSLEKPKGRKDLEKRFIDPLSERVFGNYPDLEYEVDRVRQALPSNVKIIEFYFPAGKYLSNQTAQQDYICSNYTHVVRDILERGINVVVHQVAKEGEGVDLRYSLSSNADLTLDILDRFKVMKAEGKKVISAVQVNNRLPFMYGDAVLEESDFDLIVDNPAEYYEPFGPPKASVGDAEYMIGLYGSTLIKDGGELQIGIGALGDALTYSLLLRQEKNDIYHSVLKSLDVTTKFQNTIDRFGGTTVFEEGLFGASEMMVDGFVHLMKAQILKRKVYDDLPLQRLLNEGSITEKVNPSLVEALLQVRAIQPELSVKNFLYLKKWGIFSADVRWNNASLIAPDGSTCEANLDKAECREWIYSKCLGDRLKNGSIIHAGFFMGPSSFYEELRKFPRETRQLINMRSVTKVNQLFGHEEIDRLHRKDARFVNTCLMMTLLGAAASDTLEDGRVVSGIGGQYNFVSMAHALPGGRSILNLRSTRGSGVELKSNIVWSYGGCSIPRHLRDIVVTEYGIAVLRSKTDSEVIAALLNVADSRFQEQLLAEAKAHKKIREDYQIPEEYRNNYPQSYSLQLKKFKEAGHFQKYPFGTDLTEEEQVLSIALKRLKSKSQSNIQYIRLLSSALASTEAPLKYEKYLKRMNLYPVKDLKETLFSKLLIQELREIV